MKHDPNAIQAATLTDDDLDRAVRHLRTLHKAHAVGLAIAVGEFVVREFYDGDFAAARSRDPGKHARFQQLLIRRGQELADLSLPGRTLRRCVAASDVWRGLPEESRSRLGVTHLETLAAVPNADERKRLAHEAAAMHWTGEQVQLAVKDLKRQERGEKRKPGRKTKPQVLKAAVAAHAELRRLYELRSAAVHLDGSHATEYAGLLASLQELVEKLATKSARN